MLFLDTSLLVAALTPEVLSARVQAWLSEREPADLAVSDWTIAEMSSALSIKLRTRQLDFSQRAAALAAFNRMIANSVAILPVASAHFRTAAAFAGHHTLSLKASDALHLAIAADNGGAIVTLDHRLADAGPPLGVMTQLIR